MTTVRDLINALEEIQEKYGEDTPILGAHQPNYPLAERISGVAVCELVDGEIVTNGNWCEDCGHMLDDVRLCPSCLPMSERTPEDGIREEDERHPLVWITLSGHPDEWGGISENAGFKSPYAPRGLFGEDADAFEEFLM